jgi:hypothetical protein
MNTINSIKQAIKGSLFKISPSLLKKVQNYNKEYIYTKRLKSQLEKLPMQIADFYRDSDNDEIKEIVSFISENGIHMIPYEFIFRYKPEDVIVYYDEKEQYPYVIIGENRVYFPQNIIKSDIQNAVATSLIEQEDEQSPHRYLNESIKFNCDDIAVLVGASEGIFCLSIIDKVQKVYLFEADEQWIKPLTLTFEPFKDKVKIVQKFVSSEEKGNEISLDNYFSQIGEDVNYIQADIEGNEKKLLLGAKRVLSGNNIKLSICCYHNQEDQEEFSKILRNYGFDIQYSKGYMLLWMQVPCKKPYFRKGIIYGSKN